MMRRFIGSGPVGRGDGGPALELNFKLVRVTAGGALLNLRDDLKHDGYTLQQLPGGDYVLRIRHSSSNEVAVGVEQTFGMNCRAGSLLAGLAEAGASPGWNHRSHDQLLPTFPTNVKIASSGKSTSATPFRMGTVFVFAQSSLRVV